MALTLLLIYGAYFLYLIGFVVFSAFALYHLEEYGYIGDFCRPMVYLYAGIASAVTIATFITLISL